MQQAVGQMRIGQMKVDRLRPNQICRTIRASNRFFAMESLAAKAYVSSSSLSG